MVFILRRRGRKPEEIGLLLSARYGTAEEEAFRFAREVAEGLERFSDPANQEYRPPAVTPEIREARFRPWSEKHYLLPGGGFTFRYGQRNLQRWFHPLLAHLETAAKPAGAVRIELFRHAGLLVFRLGGRIAELFRERDLAYLKGAVFQRLCGVVHGIAPRGWMMTLHASGITDGRRALLFSGESGSGKSTLAALLHARGYGLVADDFTPVGKKREQACNFPALLSVKEGAVGVLAPHYPRLREGLPVVRSGARRVRYLPPQQEKAWQPASYPVAALLFVRYEPDAGCRLEPCSPGEALPGLLAETWVHPSAANVRRFFAWVSRTRFYRLTYSDNRTALEAVVQLFDK